MASPVVEKLGQIITKQTAASPDHARALLMAAYSWVNLAGRFPRPRNVRAATERVNGGIAGTIVDSFRHPENAVMVNIFMPCEILHAMELTPMFPEAFQPMLQTPLATRCSWRLQNLTISPRPSVRTTSS